MIISQFYQSKYLVGNLVFQTPAAVHKIKTLLENRPDMVRHTSF